MHVGFAVGEEQKVRVVRALLAADPHHPDEDNVEVCNQANVKVDNPERNIDCLDNRGDEWSLKSH